MRVEIIHVEEASPGEPWVEVTSDLGRFRARWSGARPPVGAQLEVELGVDHRFTWGVDARPAEPRGPAIEQGEGSAVALWGDVEQLDDGGFVGLRFGPSVVMVEADGDPPPLGATVRLDAPEVGLFDTNV
jgi:hypothetical protein